MYALRKQFADRARMNHHELRLMLPGRDPGHERFMRQSLPAVEVRVTPAGTIGEAGGTGRLAASPLVAAEEPHEMFARRASTGAR